MMHEKFMLKYLILARVGSVGAVKSGWNFGSGAGARYLTYQVGFWKGGPRRPLASTYGGLFDPASWKLAEGLRRLTVVSRSIERL